MQSYKEWKNRTYLVERVKEESVRTQNKTNKLGKLYLLYLSGVISEETYLENIVPGDSAKQAHIFDFDDTLGVTQNASGVMLYANGQPAHRNEEQIRDWIKKMGLSTQDLLPGPNGNSIEYVSSREGFVVYLSSAGLAGVQKRFPSSAQFVTGHSEPSGKGEEILIDFTPASSVDQLTTKPIQQTIKRMKQANASGADTMVLTARRSDGTGTSIQGKKIKPTNKEDMERFLRRYGARPTQGVEGVLGQNKGHAISRKFLSGSDRPEEIHFYDDLDKNTKEVEAEIGGKVPAELHIYGPGDFNKGHVSAFKPVRSHDQKPKEKNEKL